ncbi:hypothetical protein GCM10009836_39450 [Pseudonocardia ailaonensis]|uniref:SnoaL-like domain-containing protein n=1 Tax=Pseudonocardia ailaonensis TaxID=367279 RepID=A0ABN2NB24_9PSEU
MTDLPALLERYFALAATGDDKAAYLAQFTPDAVVRDDGKTYRGVDEIAGWRTEVPLVAYAVREVVPSADRYRARTEISGAFAGSPVELTFDFTVATDGRIAALTIAP